MPALIVEAIRLPFLTGSLLPVLVVAAWAWPPPWSGLILCLLGVGCLHLGANLINDYYDARGSDVFNVRVTPFSGGSRVIQEGRMSAGKVRGLAMAFFAAGLVCGLILAAWGRPWVLVLGALGLAIGYFYSATHLALMLHGLGEIAIFFAFGPLVTWGSGYVFTGHFSTTALILGLPQAWLMSAVLWINQFPDYQADRKAGKRNLVVRLGTSRSRPWYALLMLLPFPSLALLVYGFGLSPWLYLGFFTLPLAVQAIYRAWRSHNQHDKLIPVQGMTITTHLALGILMVLGLLLGQAL